MKKLAVHEGTVLVPEPMFNAMVAVVEAAQAEARARDEMLSEVPVRPVGVRQNSLVRDWVDAGTAHDAALTALTNLVRASG